MNSLLAVINCNKYWMQIKHKRDDQIYMYILCKVSMSFIYSMSLTWKDYLIVCFQKGKMSGKDGLSGQAQNGQHGEVKGQHPGSTPKNWYLSEIQQMM